MEMRNLKYNHAGTVDAEINHPVCGWIPCTLSANDPPTSAIHAEALSGIHGQIATYVAPPPIQLTIEQIVAAESLAAAKADVAIQYLVTHTPAECYAYVQNNVTNLATATAFLGKVAMVLSIIAKDRLK